MRTRPGGLIISWMAGAALGYLLGGTPALALSCADIPNAQTDPGLDALLPYQNYGRLLPEFKSRTIKKQLRKRHVRQRVVGKVINLTDGGGHVFLRPADGGKTAAAAHISGSALQGIGAVPFETFQPQNSTDELERALADWEIPPEMVSDAPVAGKLQAEHLLEFESPVGVGQTTQALRGSAQVDRSQRVKHECSSNAAFAGNPNDLANFVVLQGTIKATVTTTRTVTERVLELVTEDQVVLESLDRSALIELLIPFPTIVAALRSTQVRADDSDADETIVTAEALDNDATASVVWVTAADEPAAPSVEATIDGTAAQGGGTSGQAEGLLAMEPDSWPTVFSLVAGLCAVVLALLFLPRLRPAETEDVEASRDEPVKETVVVAQVNAPVANDNGPNAEEQAAISSDAAEPEMVSFQSLQARIDFLETLRVQTADFQQKIEQTIARASADIGDTGKAKQELETLRALAKNVDARNAELQEQAETYKLELSKASEQALILKQKTADMGVRLAKATAIAETSKSIISELESASDAALSLNAEYRDRAREMEARQASLQAELDTIKSEAQDRQQLLESSLQTNEELDSALAAARRKSETLSQELEHYKSEHDELAKERDNVVDRLKAKRDGLAEMHARVALRAASLQEQLEAAIAERKRAEAEAQTLRKQGTRMRVEYGVRAKMLEDNVRALGSHIDELEALLHRHNIEVPTYLNVANIFDRSSDAVRSGQSDRSDPEKVLQFNKAQRRSG